MKTAIAFLIVLPLHLYGCYESAATAADHSTVTLGIDSAIYNPFPNEQLLCDYCPTILRDQKQFSDHGTHANYKMWHEGVDAISMSVSDDGIHWNLIAPTALKGCHPCVVYDENGFEDGMFFYKMWYWTGQGGTNTDVILFSKSVDGLAWQPPIAITQDDAAPLVFGNPGDAFFSLYGPGLVLYNNAPTFQEDMPYTYPYQLFYDAVNGAESRCLESIGFAFSNDGIHWKRYGNEPMFSPSPQETDWDATNAFHPSIVKVNTIFHLFYSGSNETIAPEKTVSYGHGIGHAISFDAVHWIKDTSTPLLAYSQGVEWRNGRAYRPAVMLDEDSTAVTFKMWFTGGKGGVAGKDQAIGYVTGTLH
jgi:hypothetical protein